VGVPGLLSTPADVVEYPTQKYSGSHHPPRDNGHRDLWRESSFPEHHVANRTNRHRSSCQERVCQCLHLRRRPLFQNATSRPSQSPRRHSSHCGCIHGAVGLPGRAVPRHGRSWCRDDRTVGCFADHRDSPSHRRDRISQHGAGRCMNRGSYRHRRRTRRAAVIDHKRAGFVTPGPHNRYRSGTIQLAALVRKALVTLRVPLVGRRLQRSACLSISIELAKLLPSVLGQFVAKARAPQHFEQKVAILVCLDRLKGD
jgi:hypothetical protein